MELAFQTARSSDFQGNLVSPRGPHRSSVFGLAAPPWPVSILTSLGVSGLWVDEVAGRPFPHSRGDTSSALCLRAAGGKERARAPPALGGNAPGLEDVKTQIKPPEPSTPREPRLAGSREGRTAGSQLRRLLWDRKRKEAGGVNILQGDLNFKTPVGVPFTLSSEQQMAGVSLAPEAGKEALALEGPRGTRGPFSTGLAPKPNGHPACS